MAETDNVSSSAVKDIPILNATNTDVACGVNELGTSPVQEKSSNSHPHDSEYDTASDLEGGEDYDDDDDDDDLEDDDDSLSDEDDGDEDYNEEHNDVGVGASIISDKVDTEAQKKVDEDRSNPQYIPKRGTFYEHDDRTAEGEIDVNLKANVSGELADGNSAVCPADGKSTLSPTISQASKTMKKWAPASGVDRWSHDRFDATEQAPKTRSELVSSYGYDIRTEDAPPRARRRRRYGRGPSKYSRNWEDESAYLKASNKERKPPRPSDFPALNERAPKARKAPRRAHEEKENHMERRQAATACPQNLGEKSAPNNSNSGASFSGERRDRPDIRGPKNKSYNRNSAPVGRQPAMEFKQKQRGGQSNQASGSNSNFQNNRSEMGYERPSNRTQNLQNIQTNDQQRSSGKRSMQKQVQSQQNDSYNNNNKIREQHGYAQMDSPSQSNVSMRQTLPPKTTPPSNLSQRLQQVQNRNDPSHVGSVQMHALATQNQLVNQQQQTAANIMLSTPPQQQPPILIPQEQRGPPKRYSSLRRSQHEAQHLAEQQHQLLNQQLMLQQDPHMLQANLMQLYHQENLQAQMQALQVSQQPPAQSKQTTYTTVPTAPQQQPQPYGTPATAAAPPTAYYVAAPEYATANPQAQQPPQYAQQQPNYLPQPQPAPSTTIAYPSGPPPNQPVVPGPNASPYVSTSAVPPPAPNGTVPPGAPNANPGYTNYQNYNTVGGTTYFVPPPQAPSRPVVLPQRRPTNAIPILPPSEKNKMRGMDLKDDLKTNTSQSVAPIGSAENIDHIIDNMFVQRPAFHPPQATVTQARKSSSPACVDSMTPNECNNPSSHSSEAVLNNPVIIENTTGNLETGAPVENSNNNVTVAVQD